MVFYLSLLGLVIVIILEAQLIVYNIFIGKDSLAIRLLVKINKKLVGALVEVALNGLLLKFALQVLLALMGLVVLG